MNMLGKTLCPRSQRYQFYDMTTRICTCCNLNIFDRHAKKDEGPEEEQTPTCPDTIDLFAEGAA